MIFTVHERFNVHAHDPSLDHVESSPPALDVASDELARRVASRRRRAVSRGWDTLLFQRYHSSHGRRDEKVLEVRLQGRKHRYERSYLAINELIVV